MGNHFYAIAFAAIHFYTAKIHGGIDLLWFSVGVAYFVIGVYEFINWLRR